ncbi:hypothetical protein I316_06185 [Kwoniella heveanensis BCC8398]|uniref:rRNA-processing protein FYV7 n=1 Tax=Kwoniella heveanensis BCC8398 TaxID=1296120 RepID=A0A1B9GLR6_9TREE|nr:hypothetical protein I316_06185 [Kwoniella heveanensis BCC8398]
MPRITKKQKEAGIKPKPKPKARSSGHPSSRPGGGGGEKKGFQVRPSRAPKDAYMGKAQKIKADLIQRAKMKKQYAKILKDEGMESGRLGDGTRRRNERPAVSARDDDVAGSGSSGPRREGGRGDEESERLEARAGPAPGSGSEFRSRERGEGSSRGRIGGAPENDARKSKSKFKGDRQSKDGARPYRKRDDPGQNRRQQHQRGGERGRPPHLSTSSLETDPKPQPRVRALSLSPPPLASTAPDSTDSATSSFRTLKKEAFSKYHRPRDTDPKIAHKSSAASGGYTGASGRGGAPRGQPNMGARMGALLEKIKRDTGR